MVKVDSGPGKLQENFLAEARTVGFIVYPGVLHKRPIKTMDLLRHSSQKI